MNSDKPGRYPHHLHRHLVKVDKNLYVSSSDPSAYEKMLRYGDSASPAVHLKLGQKFEELGEQEKALDHYRQAARIYPSPQYSKAQAGIRRLEPGKPGIRGAAGAGGRGGRPGAAAAAGEAGTTSGGGSGQDVLRNRMMLWTLAMLLAAAVLLGMAAAEPVRMAAAEPVQTLVAKLGNGSVGKQVVYETTGRSYLLYLPYDASNPVIEEMLRKKAVETGGDGRQTVTLLGISTADPASYGKLVPLSAEAEEEKKKLSFVSAEYNPSTDTAVRIRFFRTDSEKAPTAGAFSLTYAAANVVRTALGAYIAEKGTAPERLSDLLGNYPANYISFVPNEAYTGSNGVAQSFDGKGGWVYDAAASTAERMFYPNVPAVDVDFEPVAVRISKQDRMLELVSGPVVLASKAVGLGKNGRTPEGEFVVSDRVLDPKGAAPRAYGDGALGLGEIAIHGTDDTASIGADRSLGCIRMDNGDVLELFPFVPKGASVRISADAAGAEGAAEPVQLDRLVPAFKPGIGETAERTFAWLG
ncbi:MAG: hypothetical protein K0Q94_3464 [Paenibacillus sp.]|nr:hypothetical protein [Paenibacillus sp.]